MPSSPIPSFNLICFKHLISFHQLLSQAPFITPFLPQPQTFLLSLLHSTPSANSLALRYSLEYQSPNFERPFFPPLEGQSGNIYAVPQVELSPGLGPPTPLMKHTSLSGEERATDRDGEYYWELWALDLANPHQMTTCHYSRVPSNSKSGLVAECEN
jgi:hypothetical protein